MRPFTVERLLPLLKRPRTFWRHDVDASIPAARLMALLEWENGVHANYYLMTTSPFYTPVEAFLFAGQLSEMGHAIGWHADLRETDLRRYDEARTELRVSAHCPRPTDLWVRFPGVEYAYDPIWKDRYYADSRGCFAHGDPEDHPDRGTIQVNLHPEWWFDRDIHDALPDEEYEAFFHEPRSALAAQP